MLDDQLFEELLVEPVQVVERVDQAVSLSNAEKQGDLAQSRFQIDDDGRPLAETRQFNGAVDGERRGAGAALGAEEHQRRRGRPGALCRLAPRGRPPDRAVEAFVGRRPRKELVRARPHRLEDQIRIRLERDGEDAGVRRGGPHALDGRHRRGGIAPRVDDHQIQRHVVARQPVIDDADRNRARAEEPADLRGKGFVRADD